jgi:hypothetical protein
MLVTGMSLETFRACVARVSGQKYGGNIVVNDYREFSGNRFRVTLRATDSKSAGARRSASGRRGPWACWHAYRDVLIEVFRVNPKTRVRTGLAGRTGGQYLGVEGFRANYPATGDINIGSQVLPVTMPECCECGGNEPRTAAEYRHEFNAAFSGFWSANRITPRRAEPDEDYEVDGDPEPYRPDPDTRPVSDATCEPVRGRSYVGGPDPTVFGLHPAAGEF